MVYKKRTIKNFHVLIAFQYVVLKNSLRTLFKQFGEVLDVVAHKNIRMRGQAFVAYPDQESAEKAIKELQHFVLYDKPMVVQYARNKSDVHAKKDGDYETHYKMRLARKEEVSKMPLPGSHKPTFRAGKTASKSKGRIYTFISLFFFIYKTISSQRLKLQSNSSYS